MVIDALGVSTVLRRNLPENPFVDRSVDIDPDLQELRLARFSVQGVSGLPSSIPVMK